MAGALSWLGRLVVLTLSLLCTFAIIGSIAAIPSQALRDRVGLERPSTAPARPPADPAPEPRPVDPSPRRPSEAAGRTAATIAAPPPREDLLLWLEPLTYAVVALAGLMALAVLMLWRIAAALDARRLG